MAQKNDWGPQAEAQRKLLMGQYGEDWKSVAPVKVRDEFLTRASAEGEKMYGEKWFGQANIDVQTEYLILCAGTLVPDQDWLDYITDRDTGKVRCP